MVAEVVANNLISIELEKLLVEHKNAWTDTRQIDKFIKHDSISIDNTSECYLHSHAFVRCKCNFVNYLPWKALVVNLVKKEY